MSSMFPLLQLGDLQALQHTSRLLQAMAAQAPAPVWEAAAANNFVPYHPARRSGDVRAHMAWRTARSAAFAAGGRSWPRRTLTLTRGRVAGSPELGIEGLSHDGRTLVTALHQGPQLQVQALDLQPVCKPWYIALPAGFNIHIHPVFSPDDRAVALLMVRPPEQHANGFLLVVCTLADGALRTRWVDIECTFVYGHLSWSNSIGMLFLHLSSSGTSSDPCALHVYDDMLALLAIIPGFMRCRHNCSLTGLLTYPHVGSTEWQWCMLSHQPGQTVAVQDVPVSVSQIEWGTWLPGTGEIMLISGPERGLEVLTCWRPMHSSLLKLGRLITFPEHTTWTAGLHHIALVDEYEGQLQLFTLEPGPRLQFLHSIAMGRYSSSFKFSSDGCYLLFCYRDSHFGGRQSPQGSLGVMQVSSGSRTSVTDITAFDWQLFWVPGGICMKQACAYYFFDFPAIERPASSC